MNDYVVKARKCWACKGSGYVENRLPIETCEVCGMSFVKSRKDKTTCSRKCGRALHMRRYREKKRLEKGEK